MTYQGAHGHWASDWARHLRAVVLLAGGVRPSDLSAGFARPLVDLPLPNSRTVLSCWRDAAADLARACQLKELKIRTIVSQGMKLPAAVPDVPGVTIVSEHDEHPFRGTGGLLHDIAEQYADDDVLLVAHANQVLIRPLPEAFNELASQRGDFVLLAEPDGSSSGLQLIRCGAIKHVRAKGYVDLKEQALPQLAATHRIRVARASATTGMRVRTLAQYIHALRDLTTGQFHDVPNPYAEEWTPTFRLVQPGAHVEASAIVHDSVVMDGATVGARAVIVRSVVCPGAVIKAGQQIFDTVVRARESGARA